MDILTPDSIEKSRTQARTEQGARISGMAMEEERLVKSINDLREEEKNEKERIDTDVEDYAKEAQARKDIAAAEATRVEDSLVFLREERAELMKPILPIKEAAEKALAEARTKNEEADTRIEIADKREAALDTRESDLVERETEAARREARNTDRDVALDDRERNLNADRETFEAEKAAWYEKQQAVEDAIAHREEAVAGRERSVADQQATFAKREFDYQEKDREIKSRYEALTRTEQQFRK